jgi:hypothetical protein
MLEVFRGCPHFFKAIAGLVPPGGSPQLYLLFSPIYNLLIIQQTKLRLGRLNVGVSRSHTIRHTHTHTHTMVLLLMSDQLVAEAVYVHNTRPQETNISCPQRGSNPRFQQSDGCRPAP